MNKLIESLRKQRFHPHWLLGAIVNDFFITRVGLLDFISSNAQEIKGRILDVGCGEKPYANLFAATEYIGIDIEQSGHDHTRSNIDVFYDGLNIPFEDNSFDSIVCFEVLEHVFEPDKIVQEMHRVLKPGGKVLLTTPFIWNEHEIPYDYGRYTYFGLNHLFAKNGFKVLNQKRIVSGITLFIVLISLYVREGQELLKKIFQNSKVWKGVVYLMFRPVFFIINIIGSISSLLPKSERFYFNNGIVSEK
jgi:SAM-dependent methyltransferase